LQHFIVILRAFVAVSGNKNWQLLFYFGRIFSVHMNIWWSVSTHSSSKSSCRKCTVCSPYDQNPQK